MIRQDRSTLKKLMFMKAAAGGGSAAVERTATGNPLTFIADLARPLKSLLIPFTPQQSGTGDPSPENIRSIIPWNGLTVWNGGKNLFDKAYLSDEDNYSIYFNDYWYTEEIMLHPNTSYMLTPTSTEQLDKNRWYVLKINTFSGYSFAYPVQGGKPGSIRFTTGDKGTIQFGIYKGALHYFMSVDWQLEVGSTATAYEPYEPITETDISFPSPVYGGTLDVVSGVLTVEYAGWVGKWSEMGQGDNLGDVTRKRVQVDFSFANASSGTGNYCNIAKFKSSYSDNSVHFYVSGNKITVFLPNDTDGNTEVQVIGALATPQEITLTPEQITALVGNNTIWSDSDGSMTCVYLVSSKYAEEHPVGGLSSGLGSGLLGSNPDPDEPIKDPEENPEE